MNTPEISRREALGMAGAGALLASVRVVGGEPLGRVGQSAALKPPVTEVVNVQQFEDEAKLVLQPADYAAIEGGDRVGFNKMSLRPRQNVPTLEMNLDTPLFGQTLFTPIIVGPIADQGRYHAEGEIATMSGAAAAYTLTIVSNHSTIPLDRIAREANGPFWYSVYANESGALEQARNGVAAGAGAVFITVRASYAPRGSVAAQSATGAIDWRAVNAIRQGLAVPVVVKGILNTEEAAAAVREGFQGIVVSNHGGAPTQTSPTTIEGLPAIADAIGGKIPILADGSFRRGTDVLKALILGARAVLVGRPVMWGLASYGADGVQYVLQLTQNELARSMGMLGAVTPGQLTRDHIRIHRIATS